MRQHFFPQTVKVKHQSWQLVIAVKWSTKQFTVGVLNATLDLAALVLVGVVGFLDSEVVLSPVVSGCLPSCGGWVLVGVAAFLGSEVVLSPVVSGCLPSRGGWVLVGVAASRTKTFRNQNHRFQSKFA